MYLKSLILLMASSLFSFSYSDSMFHQRLHTFKSDETIQNVAKKYYKDFKYKYNTEQEYIVDLKKWNTHIKDWSKTYPDTKIYINYPYSPHTGYSFAKKLKIVNKED